MLNRWGKPRFVSGVPGDAFGEGGQKWCHPLYNTEELRKQNYSLLFDRMAFAAAFYDVTRIDHFQAIAMFYAIPAKGQPRQGHWEQGVGEPFVRRLAEQIGKEKIVVEDFGGFPGNAKALAKKYGLGDMQVLQFTLRDGKTAKSYPENTVAYLGTHDNCPFCGFLEEMDDPSLAMVAKLLGQENSRDKQILCQAAIEALLDCPAVRTVFQVQDLLFEGNQCRMNIPSTSGHSNWTYRLTEEKLAALEKDAGLWRQRIEKYDR